MTPIDILVSRSKVKAECQAYSLYVGEGGGALVFYKHLYFFKLTWAKGSSELLS